MYNIYTYIIPTVSIILSTSIYKGEFKFPFVIMNNKKLEQYKNEKLVKKFLLSNYDIFVVPIEYDNNKLTVDVFIEYDKIWGFHPNSIKKRLTIEKGEKLKLEIPDLKKTYKFNDRPFIYPASSNNFFADAGFTSISCFAFSIKSGRGEIW